MGFPQLAAASQGFLLLSRFPPGIDAWLVVGVVGGGFAVRHGWRFKRMPGPTLETILLPLGSVVTVERTECHATVLL